MSFPKGKQEEAAVAHLKFQGWRWFGPKRLYNIEIYLTPRTRLRLTPNLEGLRGLDGSLWWWLGVKCESPRRTRVFWQFSSAAAILCQCKQCVSFGNSETSSSNQQETPESPSQVCCTIWSRCRVPSSYNPGQNGFLDPQRNDHDLNLALGLTAASFSPNFALSQRTTLTGAYQSEQNTWIVFIISDLLAPQQFVIKAGSCLPEKNSCALTGLWFTAVVIFPYNAGTYPDPHSTPCYPWAAPLGVFIRHVNWSGHFVQPLPTVPFCSDAVFGSRRRQLCGSSRATCGLTMVLCLASCCLNLHFDTLELSRSGFWSQDRWMGFLFTGLCLSDCNGSVWGARGFSSWITKSGGCVAGTSASWFGWNASLGSLFRQ